MRLRIFFILIIIIFSHIARSDIIDAEGDQSGIWQSGNTYQVVGHIYVNTGNTLLIEPGTTVMFMAHYTFTVTGILIAAGTNADSILFTYDRSNTQSDNWNRISFEESQSSASIISYCILEYASVPISCRENANILISNNTFRIGLVAIEVVRSSPLIQYNHMDDYHKGVYAEEASALLVIRRNVFTNMSFAGVWCSSADSCLVEDNTVLASESWGIYCCSTDAIIRNNVIHGAGGYGIICRYQMESIISRNLITDSYGGVAYDSAQQTELINNTIVNCKTGLYLDDETEPIDIINNIFYDNYTAMNLHLPEDYCFSNNLFWENSINLTGSEMVDLGIICMYNNNGTPCDIYQNLFTNPLFEDPELDYYTLTINSPAIDAGLNSYEYYDPDGTIADLGAYYLPQAPAIPVAAFTSDIYFGQADLCVSFRSESTGYIDTYLWNFGDGNTSNAENPVHIYEENGEYNVSLTVSGPSGSDTCQEENYIIVMPQIQVSGDLSGLWTSEYCYCLVEDASINHNTTLTIEPGTLIRFMGQYTLTVIGTLIAEGTETDSIRFTSGNRRPFEGDWASINFITSEAEASVFTHVIVEYAEIGIYLHYTALHITNSRISDNFCGIEIMEAAPVIEGNYITSNYDLGMDIHDNSPCTVSNNYFYDNYEDIFLRTYGPPLITGNTFRKAQRKAIRCYGTTADISGNLFIDNPVSIILDASYPLIHHNVFCGGGTTGVWGFGNSNTPEIYNNTFINLIYGIRIFTSTQFLVTNNAFYGNEYALYSYPLTSNLDHNLFYNNVINYGGNVPDWFEVIEYENENSDPCDLNYNLFISPEFVDPQLLDFHLTRESPCIDAGNPDPIYNDPDDTISDIGAFYLHHLVDNDENGIMPSEISFASYPNPFNPETNIEFELEDAGKVKLTVYNIKGQKVAELIDEEMEAGKHSLVWNAKGFGSGCYFIHLSTGSYSLFQKVVLLK